MFPGVQHVAGFTSEPEKDGTKGIKENGFISRSTPKYFFHSQTMCLRWISWSWRWWNLLSRWRGFEVNKPRACKVSMKISCWSPWLVASVVTYLDFDDVNCLSSVECKIISYLSLYVQSVYLFSDPLIPFLYDSSAAIPLLHLPVYPNCHVGLCFHLPGLNACAVCVGKWS